MARITVEDCLEKVENRFALAILAAQRAKQIFEGSPVLIESKGNRPIVNALREIAADKVRFMTDEDIRKAEEEKILQRERAAAATEPGQNFTETNRNGEGNHQSLNGDAAA